MSTEQQQQGAQTVPRASLVSAPAIPNSSGVGYASHPYSLIRGSQVGIIRVVGHDSTSGRRPAFLYVANAVPTSVASTSSPNLKGQERNAGYIPKTILVCLVRSDRDLTKPHPDLPSPFVVYTGPGSTRRGVQGLARPVIFLPLQPSVWPGITEVGSQTVEWWLVRSWKGGCGCRSERYPLCKSVRRKRPPTGTVSRFSLVLSGFHAACS